MKTFLGAGTASAASRETRETKTKETRRKEGWINKANIKMRDDFC